MAATVKRNMSNAEFLEAFQKLLHNQLKQFTFNLDAACDNLRQCNDTVKRCNENLTLEQCSDVEEAIETGNGSDDCLSVITPAIAPEPNVTSTDNMDRISAEPVVDATQTVEPVVVDENSVQEVVELCTTSTDNVDIQCTNSVAFEYVVPENVEVVIKDKVFPITIQVPTQRRVSGFREKYPYHFREHVWIREKTVSFRNMFNDLSLTMFDNVKSLSVGSAGTIPNTKSKSELKVVKACSINLRCQSELKTAFAYFMSSYKT